MTSSSIFFDGVLFLLLSLVIDPGFLSVSSLVLELSQFSDVRDWPEIRNSEITPVWVVWLNIWRLGQVRDTRFGPNVSYKMLLNVGKCQNHRLYYFWVNKPTDGGGGVKLPPAPPPRLMLNCLIASVTEESENF